MAKNFLFLIDLISKEIFSEDDLTKLKSSLSSKDVGNDLTQMVLEIIQTTKDGRIEIYAEDTGININSGEEVLSFVKQLEKKIGGFVSGSSFEIGNDNPGPVEKWTKSEYAWESEETPEEDPWNDEPFWEEDEWEEWNEEWN
jgi:hypothetical protein